MNALPDLDDSQLRIELKNLGYDSGPVTVHTRSVMETKLIKMRRSSASGLDSSDVHVSRLPVSGGGDSVFRSPGKSTSDQVKPPNVPTPIEPSRIPRLSNTSSVQVNTTSVSTPIEASKHSTPGSFFSDQAKSSLPFPLNMSRRVDTTANVSRRSKYEEFDRSTLEISQDEQDRLAYLRQQLEDEKYLTPNGQNGANLKYLNKLSASGRSNKDDVLKLILMLFGSFALVLLIVYVCTAHPTTVSNTNAFALALVSESADFVYKHLVLPVLALTVVLGAAFINFFVYKKRKEANENAENRTMNMVEKILDRVKSAGSRGAAEQHLRDILMPPTRRTDDDAKLWTQAASIINNVDSRVRSENRVIDGIDCSVWTWIA